MASVSEITIDVIIHATEDSSKFLDAFNDMFGLARENFSVTSATGHYDNPIAIIGAKLRKGAAQKFLDMLLEKMNVSQKDTMISEMNKRTLDSRFHLRLGKQEFLKGVLSFQEDDAIRIRISAPIYNKKDTEHTFKRILGCSG